MPARTGRTTYVPGKGATTRSKSGKAKTYVGKGPAPAGTRKAPEKSYTEVPTVTVSDSGVTTSGFGSKKAAKRAVRAQKRSARRVSQVVAETALKPQKRSQPPRVYKAPSPKLPKPSKASRRYQPDPSKAVISSVPNPNAKPETFQGAKTVGEPSRKELQKAAKKGQLRVNRKGLVTTPRIRRVGGELRRLRSKARSSNAPLPGLDAEQTKVARKVLKTGRKVGADRKELLSAAETGLVESGFRNLPGGDADSAGWRQERQSLYPTGAQGPTNVKAAASRYFQEAKTDTGGARGRGQTAGELAQTIQASAFPERYDEHRPEAAAILNAFEKGGLKPAQRKELRKVTKEAQKLGLKVGARGKVGPAPPKVVTRYKAIKKLAKGIEKLNIPYIYGGGHNGGMPDPSEGLDCSSSTVYLLRKAGYDVPNITSGEFGNYFPSGPGAVTIFYNPTHVFLRIGNDYWGTSAGDSGNGGLGRHPAPSADYLKQYSVAHVPGLGKKQALQLGFTNLGGGGPSESFPGITLSENGTTATVTESAEVGKPGFSQKPIGLTPLQNFRQTKKLLKDLGVGESSTTTSQSSGSVLKELEKKYKVAA